MVDVQAYAGAAGGLITVVTAAFLALRRRGGDVVLLTTLAKELADTAQERDDALRLLEECRRSSARRPHKETR